MIVLISPETDLDNEFEILDQLFQKGLTYYHLRKPFKSYDDYCYYLNQIDPRNHNKIVVHHFHNVINDYNLKGLHFQEQSRLDCENNMEDYLANFDIVGKTVSSSFHDPEVLKECAFNFDYHLLSPVFSSISKSGYQGKGFHVHGIEKVVIGMGGVTAVNLESFSDLGYNGVGVLGAVWNSPDPVEVFQKIKTHYDNII